MIQPIKHCYWVLPEKLLAGEYPGDKDEKSARKKISDLLHYGVKTFIDLTDANEGLRPYTDWIGTACHHRFSIPDVSVPESPELTRSILDTIDCAIQRDPLVYVHCWGGIGRTGVIIGCWLARHGTGGKAAVNHLRELWRQCPKSAFRKSPETRQQEQYILNWKAGQ